MGWEWLWFGVVGRWVDMEMGWDSRNNWRDKLNNYTYEGNKREWRDGKRLCDNFDDGELGFPLLLLCLIFLSIQLKTAFQRPYVPYSTSLS